MNKITTMSFQIASDESHIVTVLGMDLAKNVFALHGVNAAGDASQKCSLMTARKVMFNSFG
jgi:hypothetical protein